MSKSNEICIVLGEITKKKENDDQISVVDQFKNLWRCRDFEISHFWQRNLFFQAAIMLCFTGYGTLLIKGWIPDMDSNPDCTIINIMAIALSLFSLVISIAWVAMGKASKAWYECYEAAIEAFTSYKNGLYVSPLLKQNNKNWAGFNYWQIDGYIDREVDTKLNTTKGGAYSPSKIYIMTGRFFIIVWKLTASFHSSLLIYDELFDRFNNFNNVLLYEIAMIFLLMIIFYGWFSVIVNYIWKIISRNKGAFSVRSSFLE